MSGAVCRVLTLGSRESLCETFSMMKLLRVEGVCDKHETFARNPEAIKEAVAELKSDVKDVKDYRHSDFKWYICTFGAGFVALAGLSLYLYSRIEDRLSALSTAVTKVEIRLESLQRSASPEPSAAPKKQGGAP